MNSRLAQNGTSREKPPIPWKAAIVALGVISIAFAAVLAAYSIAAAKAPTNDTAETPATTTTATTPTTVPPTTTTDEPPTTIPPQKPAQPEPPTPHVTETTASTTTTQTTATTISPYAGKGYRQAWLKITIPSPHCEQALLDSLKNQEGIVSMKVKRGEKNNTIIYDPQRISLPDLVEFTASVGGSTLLKDEGI